MADEGDNVVEVLPSRNKGFIKLAMNGFVYTKHNETSDRLFWRCNVIRGNKDTGRVHCGGRITTDTACLQAEVVQHHRHPPNHGEVAMMKMQHLVGQRLAEIHQVDVATVLKTSMKNLKLHQAVGDVLEKMTEGERELLPSEEDCVYQCSNYLRNRRSKGSDGHVIRQDAPEVRKLFSGDDGDNILETFDTRNGFTKVALNGFVYTKHYETEEKIGWRCVEKGCPGRAHSDLESLHAQSSHGHTHPPDRNMVESMRIRRTLKARLLRPESAYRTYADIVDELMAELPPHLKETVVQRKNLLVFAKNLAHKQGLKRLHKKGKRGKGKGGADKKDEDDNAEEQSQRVQIAERLPLPSTMSIQSGQQQPAATYPEQMQHRQTDM